MSYIRKLPSGKWQATVRGPDGVLAQPRGCIGKAGHRMAPTTLAVANIEVHRDDGNEEGQRLLDRDVAYVRDQVHVARAGILPQPGAVALVSADRGPAGDR